MLHKVVKALFLRWVEDVQTANITYFRVRRQAYEDFVAIIGDSRSANPVECAVVSAESFFVIKQVLTSRKEAVDNNARLAFDRVLVELDRACRQRVATPLASEVMTEAGSEGAP